jgi:hypothetical protein
MLKRAFGGCNKRLEKPLTRIFIIYSTPNITKLMRSRSMKWVELVPLLGETRNAHKLF